MALKKVILTFQFKIQSELKHTSYEKAFFDLAYPYTNGKERSVENKMQRFFGDVYAQVHAISLGLTYNS